MMKRKRRGKIVTTVGPAVGTQEKLEQLYLTGADVFRMNFSHGTHDDHKGVYESIRRIGKKLGAHPTILADLQGPKIRIGTFENDKIILDEGDVLRLDLDPTPGNTQRVNLPHPEVLSALTKGSLILMNDGNLRFEIVERGEDYVDAKVLVGGQLSNRKGVNIPGVMLPIPALTEKDRIDLEFALQLGVDWVALSFVQNVEDVLRVLDIVKDRAKVMAKIEKPLAVKAIEPITQVADGIMVARGDLGVEMDFAEVPGAQRLIIETCHRLGKPVVVATQMLESMITACTPTRAEVSDVANAIYGGADAVMLSAESASGKYPFEAVDVMQRVITKTESDKSFICQREDKCVLPIDTDIDAICVAAKGAARFSNAKCIVLFTDSFKTVARLDRLNPMCHVLVATGSDALVGQAGLVRGMFATVVKKEFNNDLLCKKARELAADHEFAKTGDNVVMLNDFEGHSVHILTI